MLDFTWEDFSFASHTLTEPAGVIPCIDTTIKVVPIDMISNHKSEEGVKYRDWYTVLITIF